MKPVPQEREWDVSRAGVLYHTFWVVCGECFSTFGNTMRVCSSATELKERMTICEENPAVSGREY